MMLDKRKNPKLRQVHISWKRLMCRKKRRVRFTEPLEQRICETNKYKECGYVKFNFGDWCSCDGVTPNVTSQRAGSVFPDFGGARLKCTDELDVSRSIAGRYAHVCKISASAAHMCNTAEQCLWWDVVEATSWDQNGATGRSLQAEMNRLIQRYGRKTLVLPQRARPKLGVWWIEW